MSPYLRFASDLASLAVRHPRWLLQAVKRQLLSIRSEGTAQFTHGLRMAYHHRLDARLERLPVEIGVASHVDYRKALIVARLCRLLDPRRVLEIGTYRGGMTMHIARNTHPSCQIFTLDLPPGAVDDLAEGMIATDVRLAQLDRGRVGSEWREAPEAARITQLWGDSFDFDFNPLGRMDLVYVDGSHAERWVRKDTENAFRLLAPTGAIIWDDCLWGDVQRTLGDVARARPVFVLEDRCTAVYLQIDGRPVGDLDGISERISRDLHAASR